MDGEEDEKSGKYIMKILFLTIWSGVLIAGIVDGITNDGIKKYFSHFTNWSWSIQCCFFVLVLWGILSSEEIFDMVIYVTLVPVWAIAWGVFVLVLAMVLADGNFVMRYVAKHKSGLVFFGNALYHYIPPIMILFFIIFYYSEIDKVFCKYISNKKRIEKISYWSYCVFFSIVWFLFYMSIHDYRQIYETQVNLITGSILLLITEIISVTFIIIIFGKKTKIV